MNKVLMHVDHLSERGTTTALFEYAKCLSEIGNEVSIFYQKNSPHVNIDSVKQMNISFPTVGYTDFYELNKKYSGKFEYAYFLKGGENDGKLLTGAKNYIHAIFQFYEPHGTSYAYVSSWLADEMRAKIATLDRGTQSTFSNGFEFKYVPHIVDMPKNFQSIRDKIGVPANAICGVRIGGKDSFDIPWVQWAVKYMAEEYGYYFVFINTDRFSDHRNIIYLDTITSKQYKADVLASADFFIHGRSRGESFGISIIEALQISLPVLAWSGGIDKNHTHILGPDSLYRNSHDLIKKMRDTDFRNWNKVEAGQEFRPKNVMDKFLEVFPID